MFSNQSKYIFSHDCGKKEIFFSLTALIASLDNFFASTNHWSVRNGSKISPDLSPKGTEYSYFSFFSSKPFFSKYSKIFSLAFNLSRPW